MKRVVALEGKLVDQRERGGGPLNLSNRDRAVERHHRRGRYREQPVVEDDDLRPVGLLERRSVGVDGVMAA